MSVPGGRDIERLREHFRARDLFERRETSSLVRRGSTACERSWRSSEGPSMKPCIANGENAVIAFWVGVQRARKSGQEALRHTGSITITSCWASSAGRYRHETTVEYRGPWRQIS